jgi:hypothetical protein
MNYPWFKFFGSDYLIDDKMLGFDGHIRSCWLTLLCFASQGAGTARYLTEDQLMIQAGVPMGGSEWDRTVGVLSRFEARNMIRTDEKGIHIVNWEKRQASYLTEGERSKMKRMGRSTGANPVTRPKNDTLEVEEEVEEDILFDRVWSVYPVKKGKKPAHDAFRKLKPTEDLTSRIVSAIALAKTTSQWKDNEGRYVPHCATYLNQRRFEDELPPPKPVIVGYEETERGMKPILDPEIEKIRASFKGKTITHHGDGEITIPT